MTEAPRALTWTTLVLAVVGLAVSIYLAYEHASGSTTLACPDTGTINCQKVTTSTYSVVAGIPVAYLGVAWAVALVAATTPAAWRSAAAWVRVGRLGLEVVGLVFAVYLVWTEFYRLDAICLWCTSVHVIVLLVFVATVFAEAWRGADLSPV